MKQRHKQKQDAPREQLRTDSKKGDDQQDHNTRDTKTITTSKKVSPSLEPSGNGLTFRTVIVGLFMAWLGISVGQWLRHFRRHGFYAFPFVQRRWFDMHWNSSQWDDTLQKKFILHLGGPHRGGTTILWKCLQAHPEIASFPPPFVTGADFSEGIFMQDVYPGFGIGVPQDSSNEGENNIVGLGRYALSPEAHLTAEDSRVSVESKLKLLNRFGPHWDLTKPVLMEKSPPNAVISTFLQAVYNTRDDTKGDRSHSVVRTKFLFITRHPIANALAHQKVDRSLTMSVLMENYLQLHRYLLEDLPKLRNDPLLLYLEEFVSNPRRHLIEIFRWLDVDSSEEIVQDVLNKVAVHRDVNDKYQEWWCKKNSRGESPLIEQLQLWDQALKALPLKYSILDWCHSR